MLEGEKSKKATHEKQKEGSLAGKWRRGRGDYNGGSFPLYLSLQKSVEHDEAGLNSAATALEMKKNFAKNKVVNRPAGINLYVNAPCEKRLKALWGVFYSGRACLRGKRRQRLTWGKRKKRLN